MMKDDEDDNNGGVDDEDVDENDDLHVDNWYDQKGSEWSCCHGSCVIDFFCFIIQ